VVRSLECQIQFPALDLFGQTVGLNDLHGGREGAWRLVGRRVDNRHKLSQRLDKKLRGRIRLSLLGPREMRQEEGGGNKANGSSWYYRSPATNRERWKTPGT
jgi:hypothetical protein